FFVDSTMIRFWGSDASLRAARQELERAAWPGRWLEDADLRERQVPRQGHPYGNAFFLLDEGVLFAPSFLGGRVAGMHGYDLTSSSCRAALASDVPIPEDCRAIVSIAPVVRA